MVWDLNLFAAGLACLFRVGDYDSAVSHVRQEIELGAQDQVYLAEPEPEPVSEVQANLHKRAIYS
jgi:hypothetical protein